MSAPDTFIHKYLLANSGTMVPMRYHLWGALSVLACVTGRKVFIDHQHYILRPPLYITLVGRPAMRKTVAKDKAKAMLLKVFPDYPIGANVTTREKIIERMSKEESERHYLDEKDQAISYRPMGFFINELKNFMSFAPASMVEFLTDIYSTDYFDSETLRHGMQPIINPVINILACEAPKWIIEKFKLDIIAGGFSRRMLYVYEIDRPPRITFPIKSAEAYAAEAWCHDHLRKVSKMAGPFTWTEDARIFFDKWFLSLPVQTDPVLEDFYEAKDVLVQKVAMLVALAQPDTQLVLTKDIIKHAITILESIEQNLPKLTLGVGKNDQAIIHQSLLTMLRNAGGCMSEKTFRMKASLDLKDQDYQQVKKFLMETDQIKVELLDKSSKTIMVMTTEWYDKKRDEDAATTAKNLPPAV